MKTSPYKTNFEGKPRKIGIEIEFAGLDIEQIAEIVTGCVGGKPDFKDRYVCEINGTEIGEHGPVVIELDAAMLKDGKLTKYMDIMGLDDPKISGSIEDFLSKAAASVVPMEIVTPPIPFDQMDYVEAIREALRKNAAEGTEFSILHAFGLHLNPELPSLDAPEIRDFLRAFLVMYEWLDEKHRIDTSRKLTPYIDPIPDEYALLILQEGYDPDVPTLIDGYLKHNPTRNRPLDMLPLFTFMDKERVLSVVDDGLTSSRPTFHYRLPNCEISNSDWSIAQEWNHWAVVERVAYNKEKLNELCANHLYKLQNPAKHKLDFTLNAIKSFLNYD